MPLDWDDGMLSGGGLHDGLAELGWEGVGGDGKTTLGGSCVGILGRPGNGDRKGWWDGEAIRRHDSKISLRLVIASTCEMLVGGGAPVSALVTTWRP